ncbi:hypothetical protein H671_4g12305, partial [Cricetulus griseus]
MEPEDSESSVSLSRNSEIDHLKNTMLGESIQEFSEEERAAKVIQRAWKNFLNVAVFQHFKSLIDLRRQGEPRQIVKFINPKEAELLDAAAGIQVRFRLGG